MEKNCIGKKLLVAHETSVLQKYLKIVIERTILKRINELLILNDMVESAFVVGCVASLLKNIQ